MDLQQLTKKNQEFIHIATNKLIQDGKSNDDIKAILEDVLPTILEHQKKGITARNLLGAPTNWAASFSETATGKNNKSAQEKNTNPWLMWLDTSLLIIGLVALLNGIMALFSAKTEVTGILSLLTLGFGGGASMYATYYFVYRHIGKDKKSRPSWFKIITALTLAMFIWFALYSATAFLPLALNPKLPPVALLIIGAGSLGARFFLQSKYNIQNAMAVSQD
ncbi:DUF1129 domain-containing protein [Streptococcus phocae subsp. salmonis]|uniref:DUF1129 domain-containing protein n=1 Tax=Streptococcus phocae TaxID=119224 RepID=UPI000531D235|nr:DUF1129 family protein [Streptococcus phocae]KGR73071.1 membrane protein [Streptococcus phocae subsp. salmonis]